VPADLPVLLRLRRGARMRTRLHLARLPGRGTAGSSGPIDAAQKDADGDPAGSPHCGTDDAQATGSLRDATRTGNLFDPDGAPMPDGHFSFGQLRSAAARSILCRHPASTSTRPRTDRR